MIIDRNPILNNRRFTSPKTTKTIRAFGVDHEVPNRAQHVKMEGRAYYWFAYTPKWVRVGERYQWQKIGVESGQWGICR